LARQGTWSNVHVCKHFINTDRFAPNAAVRARMRKQLDAEQRFVALVIAQLIPEKGVDVALRALAELPERAVLWIAGAGSQANELQTLAHTLGVEERVRFLGLQRQVEPYLQAADCLVLPSRWQEAAGLVLLEAQSAGLPVVASRIGGIPEYVDEGRSGFLFTPESAAELADHLRTLCADAGLSRRMGAHARVHVIARHSVEAQMGTWLDLYRS
jgi:glycosyltransferase involved in cell wall biosynthesis